MLRAPRLQYCKHGRPFYGFSPKTWVLQTIDCPRSVAGLCHEKQQSGDNQGDKDDAGPEACFEDTADDAASRDDNGEQQHG